MPGIDWRLPAHRREAFGRFYDFHLATRSHPGMVYSFLPAIAEEYDLDAEGRAWLVWLNGNTQNAVTSLLLLDVSEGSHLNWRRAVDFWDRHFKLLEWDTDRRHQKSKFGDATAKWAEKVGECPSRGWEAAGLMGWQQTWDYAFSQPYMGRLSAWSMTEYARILLGPDIPDADDFMFSDHRGSNSHRNGLHVVLGYDSAYWKPGDERYLPDDVMEMEGDVLLRATAARARGWEQDVTRLTMESALCTYKSWHKPNRRYPGVYADMMYNRIRKGENRFGKEPFGLLWRTRQRDLPEYMRLEDNPTDPGLSREKQNHYLETGEIPVMGHFYEDMELSTFDLKVDLGLFGTRKEPK